MYPAVVVNIGRTGLSLAVRTYLSAGDGSVPSQVGNSCTVSEVGEAGDYAISGFQVPRFGNVLYWMLYEVGGDGTGLYLGSIVGPATRSALPQSRQLPAFYPDFTWVSIGSSARLSLRVALADAVDAVVSCLLTVSRVGVGAAGIDPSLTSGVTASIESIDGFAGAHAYLLGCDLTPDLTNTLTPGHYSCRFVVTTAGGKITLPPGEMMRFMVEGVPAPPPE